MKSGKLTFLLIVSFFSFFLNTCAMQNVYKNQQHNYQVTFPKGYLALKSSINPGAQEQFLNSIKSQGTFISLENVDVVFCNPQGSAPHYNLISINTIQQSINIAKFRKKEFEDVFLKQLMLQTGASAILSNGFSDIGKSKVYQVDLKIELEGEEYHSTCIILPFAFFASHLFSTIYSPADKDEAVRELRIMIKSFRHL